jgi:N utilization substance protein A
VRHYFGQYEEGEERPAEAPGLAAAAHIADAQAEEEIEALEQNLTQAGEDRPADDGSGLINDELAEERLAEVTEEGAALSDEGAESLDPGREDTSEVLAAHHPREENDAAGEGNFDEPKDEAVEGRKKEDEGGA